MPDIDQPRPNSSQVLKLSPFERVNNRDRFLLLLVAFGLAILISAASYPGYMSFDSVETLRQARGAVEGSQYPPFGSYVWRVFDFIWPGPTLMQFVQNCLLLVSFACLIARTRLPVIFLIACVCGFAFVPPLFGTMIVVWKDVAVAACYMAALAFLASGRSERWPQMRTYIVLGLFLTWCGMAYRFNAATGAFPLAVLAVHQIRGKGIGSKVSLSTIISGGVLTVAMFTMVWLVNSYRFPTFERLERNTNSDSIMRYDLIGISAFSGVSVVPSVTGQPVPVPYLKSIYDPRHLNITGNNDVQKLVAGQIPNISSLWMRSIAAHPIAYLHHRADVFREYIGLHSHDVFYVTNPSIDANHLGVSFTPTSFKSWFATKMWDSRNSLFCRAYLYYVFAALLLVSAFIFGDKKYTQLAAFSLASGYLYLFPMFVITPAADLRYNCWSVAASILADIFSIASIRSRLREQQRS